MPTLQEIKDIAFARYIEKSTHRNFQNTISIEDGKIYELISTMVDSISASLTGGGGGGEANTASNIGSVGDGVFAQKVGVDLQFKNLIAGNGIAITPSASALSISASGGGGGEANTASNVGTGDGQVFKEKSGVDLRFKTIKDGNGIDVQNGTDEITIVGKTISNVGTGAEIIKEEVANDYKIRSIKGAEGVQIDYVDGGNSIQISINAIAITSSLIIPMLMKVSMQTFDFASGVTPMLMKVAMQTFDFASGIIVG